jgi:hypothetical protein
MSDIPRARAILRAAMQDMPEPWRTSAAEALAIMTRRSPAKPVAAARKRRVGPDLAAEIRRYVETHPAAHLQDVAVRFGVNSGRVSEAIHGDR